jgi:hypothetical protein
MFGSLGLPELAIVFVVGLYWLLPIAIAQHALGAQLETIEQLLRGRE